MDSTLLLFCILSFIFVLNDSQRTCYSPLNCSSIMISDSATVGGYAYKSGYGSDTNISVQLIEGYGSYAFREARVLSATTAKCYGDNSCSFVDTTMGSAISSQAECSGTMGCANYQTIGNVGECYGDLSCVGASFNGSYDLLTGGTYSLYNATYTSGGGPNYPGLVLSGYHAGYGFKIICENGDFCTITCRGNGCSNTIIDCQGSTYNCLVDCNDTQSNPCPITLGTGLTIDTTYDDLIFAAWTLDDDLCDGSATKIDDYLNNESPTDHVINNDNLC